MAQDVLFGKIDDRIAIDKEDGDYAYFQALSLKLEYVTKIVTSGVIACIGNDIDRHRYSLEHKLIRANSLGEWVVALNNALVGPPAQFFDSDARDMVRDLTERVGRQDWRHGAVTNLNKAATEVGSQSMLGEKVSLRQFFEIAVQFRNRTRGHGATTNYQCGRACRGLEASLQAVVTNLEIFKLPWCYLNRNLSGKYRVSPLWGNTSSFDYLKSARDVQLPNGVFLYLRRPVHIPLVFSDPDLLDISLPNGSHREGYFETLSYVSNEEVRRDGSAWSDPATPLPQSETEGAAVLEPLGNTFTNVPPRFEGYVPRPDLEDELRDELLNVDRHPIITLTGPGGIGKTAIAVAAIHSIAERETPPYELILWISARDIDLLESGPKPVTPRVISQRDISQAAVELLEPSERSSNQFDADSFFQSCLARPVLGPSLFVLDNFETVQSPNDVFKWIDTYIRPPNKVLITTRFRDFNADYAIKIEGMTDDQAGKLVNQHVARLNIGVSLTSSYRRHLIRESDGHPYVMKIFLGQVAKEGRAINPERVVASADDLLKALFERTYSALSPGAQRVFLLLCSWRVYVPEVAVEAVLLRPGIERFDVKEALRELHRFSLVDQVFSGETDESNEAFVGVPLAAAMYGRRKLPVSALKVEIEEDRKLLMEFGAGKKEAIGRGILPRIENLIRAVAQRTSTNPSTIENSWSVLEYLAARVPKAYRQLSDLACEVGNLNRAKEYTRNYLENAPFPEQSDAWKRLADLCQSSSDPRGEIHALSELAILFASDQEEIGGLANRLNNRIRELKGQNIHNAWTGNVRGLLNRVIEAMERQFKTLSATNCSRLAWLYLNVSNSGRAFDVAKAGIERDPSNEHCQNLIQRLER